MSDCPDKDCPSCKLERIFTEMKEYGLAVEDIMPMIVMVLGDVFPLDSITLLDETVETRH